MGIVDTIRFIENVCEDGLIQFLDRLYNPYPGSELDGVRRGVRILKGEPPVMETQDKANARAGMGFTSDEIKAEAELNDRDYHQITTPLPPHNDLVEPTGRAEMAAEEGFSRATEKAVQVAIEVKIDEQYPNIKPPQRAVYEAEYKEGGRLRAEYEVIKMEKEAEIRAEIGTAYVEWYTRQLKLNASGNVSFSVQGLLYGARPSGPSYLTSLPDQDEIKFPAITVTRIGSLSLLTTKDYLETDVFMSIDCRCNPMAKKPDEMHYASALLDQMVAKKLARADYVTQVSSPVDDVLEKPYNVLRVVREIQTRVVPSAAVAVPLMPPSM